MNALLQMYVGLSFELRMAVAEAIADYQGRLEVCVCEGKRGGHGWRCARALIWERIFNIYVSRTPSRLVFWFARKAMMERDRMKHELRGARAEIRELERELDDRRS